MELHNLRSVIGASIPAVGGSDAITPPAESVGHLGDAIQQVPVELCHHRLVIFSVAVTLALGLEVGYAQVVPKLPQLYAVLLRAAVWDCMLVGVFVAQATDLMSTPLVAGTDGSHFFPLAVLLYHVLCIVVCAGTDLCARARTARGRSWHRSLVLRRALVELAGGSSGSRLALGRVCFIVSGGAMWLALRALLWIGSGSWALSAFIITLFAAYSAAGFAALEPRRTLPGNLVQWLCTGWGLREAIIHGPLKLVGALLLLPFAASVIAAQIWLRAVVFLVWITVAYPCCRLRRNDDVYDAFGREVALPLLQCSFLAFSCTLAAIAQSTLKGELVGTQYMAACVAAVYYTAMLLLWTAPMVLNAKVAFEEAFDLSAGLTDYAGDESQAVLLQGESRSNADMEGVELEDVKATCEELRALLHRQRHDHSIEVMQLEDKMRDADLRTRLAQRSLQEMEKTREQFEEALSKAVIDVDDWRTRCEELGKQLDKVSKRNSEAVKVTPATSSRPGLEAEKLQGNQAEAAVTNGTATDNSSSREVADADTTTQPVTESPEDASPQTLAQLLPPTPPPPPPAAAAAAAAAALTVAAESPPSLEAAGAAKSDDPVCPSKSTAATEAAVDDGEQEVQDEALALSTAVADPDANAAAVQAEEQEWEQEQKEEQDEEQEQAQEQERDEEQEQEREKEQDGEQEREQGWEQEQEREREQAQEQEQELGRKKEQEEQEERTEQEEPPESADLSDVAVHDAASQDRDLHLEDEM